MVEAFDAVAPARPVQGSQRPSAPPDPRAEPEVDASPPRSVPPADPRAEPEERDLAFVRASRPPPHDESPLTPAPHAAPEGRREAPASPPPVAPARVDADDSAVSTHLTAAGEVRMVDVGGKPVTARRAVAAGSVRMLPATIARLAKHDTPKGEVLATARVAGILAAKRTHELVPLCHSVQLTNLKIHMDLDLGGARVNVTAVAETEAKTGVEMEALTAVSVACLTIYDMLKGIDRDMVVSDVKLVEKSGGRTGHWRRDGA